MVVWINEDIPDLDNLYYRIHEIYIESIDIYSAGFKSQKGSMSTDWAKYSTPQKSRDRAKEPAKNFIVELNTGEVREIPMTVKHSPKPKINNRAHTDVFGLEGLEKDDRNEMRMILKEIAEWVIPPLF